MYGLVSPGKNCCCVRKNWTCVLVAFVTVIRENCLATLDVFTDPPFSCMLMVFFLVLLKFPFKFALCYSYPLSTYSVPSASPGARPFFP